jgi:DNA-binding MarR family transcriptional regulator
MIVLTRTVKVKERLNIMVNSESENLTVTLWRTLYQTYSRFKNCFDNIVVEQGLTMEQYVVLSIIKHSDPPVTITDVARLAERSTNSVSMLVDRMVKAGLLRRVRDKKDRRVVNVFLTSKAQNAFESATMPIWEFWQQAMSPLSYEDKKTFASLFRMINYKLLEHLNPGADVEGMLKNDFERQNYLIKQFRKQSWLAISEAKRGSRKR